MIRAVVFDFDGLLVDSETLFHRVYAEILADHGHPFTRNDYSAGYAGRPVPAIARAFVTDFKLPLSSEEVARRIHADEAALRAEGVPLKPGARELLDHLKARGYRIGVASSSQRPRAMSVLEQHGLVDFFAASAFAEDISRGKPDPEVFLLAAARLGIDPSECLVLEDSTMGIEAAVNAGMRVICIPDMQAPDEEHRAMATAVLDGLNDVIGFLEKDRSTGL
ncbi:MAG: HAD family phosphatase [Schaalia hyovaginalis]|uniref:HAD family hydrolase n=1 Tax=Schaalia hyovaginalis TaxID=29316 RepID=UPI002A9166D6|nr:HAD family phosphatase [Schaalia hyovaginalis]MDY6212967.1 HAD family phosphatase [Schaalia hyovaginalis]